MGAHELSAKAILTQVGVGLLTAAIAAALAIIFKAEPGFLLPLIGMVVGAIPAFLITRHHYIDLAKTKHGIPLTPIDPEFETLASFRRILSEETTRILTPLRGKQHPIVRFLEAWYSQVADELRRGGADSFEVDPSYYSACLARLNKGKETIRAIADFSVDIEGFWMRQPPVEDTKVTERIFLLRPDQFFDNATLYALTRTLMAHASIYSVRITHLSSGHERLPFDDSPGRDMILVDPDLVGGYSSVAGRNRLRIERSRERFKHLSDRYETIRKSSVAVNVGADPTALRTNWMQENGIGVWDKSWSKAKRVKDRSPDYFEKYDANIRAWVPFYDEFIRRCGRVILDMITEKGRHGRPQLRLLEIGFGTGSLTAAVAAGLEPWSKDTFQYYGIDEAEDRMRFLFQNRVRDKINVARFDEGKAESRGPWLMPGFIDNMRPFDLIFGSLVLHDLVSGYPRHKFADFLRRSDHYLSRHGAFIFADVFTSDDPTIRKDQHSRWLDAMEGNGLSVDHARGFLDSNDDMINTLNKESLTALASEFGFTYQLLRVGPDWSPFQVLVMDRAV